MGWEPGAEERDDGLRRRWLEASLELVAALHAPMSLPQARAEVLARVRAVAGSPGAAVLVSARGAFETAETSGEVAGEVAGHDGPSTRVTPHAAALRRADRDGVVVSEPGAVPGTATVCVGLDTELAPRSVLLVVVPADDPLLDPAHHDVLAGFASQAALALDRIEAMEEHRSLLLLDDRERIARDLHDLVIQRLFAAGMRLQVTAVDLEPGSPLAGVIADAVGELNAVIGEIRASIFQLEQGSDLSVREEIGAIVEEYAEVLGHAPGLRLTGPLDAVVGQETRPHLMATLRETLSNVARHAEAATTTVTVAADLPARELVLVVSDDGVGVGGDTRQSGLRNLAGRAEELGGRFEAVEQQPEGTVQRWVVPLQR